MSSSKRGKKVAGFAVLSLIAFIIVTISVILTPILAIFSIAENLLQPLNHQTLVIEKRAVYLMANKINPDQTKSKYQPINQLRQASNNLISNLEKNGFKLETNNNYITKLSFDGKTYNKQSFVDDIFKNKKLYQAFAYSINVDRVAFQDSIANEVNQSLQIDQDGFNNEAGNYNKQELAITKINQPIKQFKTDLSEEESEQQTNAFSSIKQNLEYMNQTARQISKTNKSPIHQKFKPYQLLEPNFVKQKSACGMIENSLFLQEYAKKSAPKAQSRAAFNFLVEADKIKLDKSNSEAVDYYLRKLQNGPGNVKSANQSFAYLHFIENENIPIDYSAERFILGAGPTVNKTLADQENCQNNNFFNNIFNLNSFTNNINLSEEERTMLTDITLASMTNLKTAPNLKGEDFFNSTAAGLGYYAKEIAKKSGATILTQDEAVNYFNQQNQLLAFKNSLADPLDTKNSHSLIAKLNLKLFALTNSSTSVNHFFSSILANAKSSLFNNQTKADASTYQKVDLCQDSQYLKLNQYLDGKKIALDANCNPIYGMRTDLLTLNPEQTIINLVNSKDLKIDRSSCDKDGLNCKLILTNRLAYFKNNCLNKDDALLGQDINKDLICMARSDSEKLLPAYFIDRRVLNMLNKVSKS